MQLTDLISSLFLLAIILIVTLTVLLSVPYFTLIERQILGSIQRRVGPINAGFIGLIQPFYDAIKLGLKEFVLPSLSVTGIFLVAPIISFILSQLSFCGIYISDSPFQGLVLIALSSLGVYGVLLAGWSSNSKYAFLGCLRSVALMVSYELGFGAVLLSVALFLTDSTGIKSLNFGDAASYIQFALLPIFLIFVVCILAETKRIPFDLPEAEAELVAGYNVEYSSLGFALFFIAEYANIAVMSILACIYFLGGISALKLTALIFSFIWVRGTLPRYRYDSFMRIGWKVLLPISLSLYSIYACYDYVF